MSSLQSCSSTMDMSSSISLAEPFDRASLPSPILNLLNTRLDDAHQRFRKKMDQLADMHVCSICKEFNPVIATKKFDGAYTFSCCILERKDTDFHCKTIWTQGSNHLSFQYLHKLKKCSLFVLTQSYKSHMLMVVNINILDILFASPKTFPILPNTYHI